MTEPLLKYIRDEKGKYMIDVCMGDNVYSLPLIDYLDIFATGHGYDDYKSLPDHVVTTILAAHVIDYPTHKDRGEITEQENTDEEMTL